MIDQEKMSKVKDSIKTDIENNRIMLFMKGSKEMPQCGFSAKVIEILNYNQANYSTRNVLEDDYIRQAIKEHSDWPTIPQLYVNQEFVGGCDIVMELQGNGELKKMLES